MLPEGVKVRRLFQMPGMPGGQLTATATTIAERASAMVQLIPLRLDLDLAADATGVALQEGPEQWGLGQVPVQAVPSGAANAL